jgi:sugar/nucleoside kinase (ribokinase family)
LLVVGCVSSDTLHLEQSGERRTYLTTGGAGLYTALAASAAGADVTLYAPKLETRSAKLITLTKNINWIGPIVRDESLMPRLEIVHHGDDRATLLGAGWGAESEMNPENLEQQLEHALVNQDFDIAHIAALSHPSKQVQFAEYCRKKYGKAAISAGTYARAISMDKLSVLKLVGLCDYFFMNANESRLLSADQAQPGAEPSAQSFKFSFKNHLFVTDAGAGVTAFCPDASSIKAKAVHLDSGPFDPTGAGDSFCGATLARLGAGRTPDKKLISEAILAGIEAATAVIKQPGSEYYQL